MDSMRSYILKTLETMEIFTQKFEEEYKNIFIAESARKSALRRFKAINSNCAFINSFSSTQLQSLLNFCYTLSENNKVALLTILKIQRKFDCASLLGKVQDDAYKAMNSDFPKFFVSLNEDNQNIVLRWITECVDFMQVSGKITAGVSDLDILFPPYVAPPPQPMYFLPKKSLPVPHVAPKYNGMKIAGKPSVPTKNVLANAPVQTISGNGKKKMYRSISQLMNL